MGIVAVGGFFIQLPIFVVTAPLDFRRAAAGRFFRLMAVAIAKASPFWDFRVYGPVTRPSGRTVVVSNHESNADPFLISFLPWEMKYLAKKSLMKIPFVGWSMRLAGDVAVERGRGRSGRHALEICAKWLERGMPVMIFPEGTRSKTAELLPFKDGAFRLAIETGAEILPLAVAGTRKALPKNSWRFARAKALVTVGTPISTREMTLDDLERLKAETRAQIEAMRATLQRQLAV